MMNATISDIQSRQQALVAECAAQRRSYAEAWEGLERPLLRGKQAVRKMSSPWIWIGIGLVALKLPIRKVSRIPILIWKGWQMVRKVQSMIG
jgi:hypothetical protein